MAPCRDLFSLLPDALIITILSLLPIKEAIRTSILAKPWRYLWCHRSVVELNENFFCNLDSSNPDITSVPEAMETLKITRAYNCLMFGFWWLENATCPSTISSFILTFSNPRDSENSLRDFIEKALTFNPKSLELDFSSLEWEGEIPLNSTFYKVKFELFDFVYDYKSLESLKLMSCSFRGDKFRTLGLTLKSVFLGWLDMSELELWNLVRLCPLLESLTLFKCFGSTVYKIVSKSLKTLIVDKCIDLLNFDVVTPNLTCFKYCGTLVRFGTNNFPLLETAELDLGLVSMYDEEDCVRVVCLVYGFYFARSLKVCSYITQILSLEIDDLPGLPGRPVVKNLTIQSGAYVSEYRGIYRLLKTHPLLEKLKFEFGPQTCFVEDVMFFGTYTPESFWSEVKLSEALQVLKNLKVVEATGFNGNPNEVDIISFLIFYGRGLESLIFRVAKDNEIERFAAMRMKRFFEEPAHRVPNSKVVVSIIYES